MKYIRSLLLTVAALLAVAGVRAADTYKIDGDHATVTFTISHLLISEVGGRFNKVAGEITIDKDIVTGAKATIQAASIDTANEARDKHLRSADFFDVDKFPTITFESTKIEKDVIIGKFTMHGVTKEVRLPFTLKGPINAMGKDRVAVSTETSLSRKDYGVGSATPAIGDEVKIKLSIEAIKE